MKRAILIGCALLLPLLLRAGEAPRQVFAHYMVALRSYGGSVEGYQRDIREAQAAGIDGFALNCGAWREGNYQEDTAKIFRAAKELGTGFRLFFSADMATGLTDQEIRAMVTAYAGHPNYLRHAGRPVLSTFGGEALGGKWWLDNVLQPLEAGGDPVFFIPYFYTTPVREIPDLETIRASYDLWWKDVIDGHFFFGAAGLPDALVTAGEAQATVMREHGKPYMASVTPQYWGMKQEGLGRRYFEYRGGEGLAAQWESVIRAQKPDWVQLVTWNDFTEATYFSPIDDPNRHWPYAEPQNAEQGFFKSHAGALELCKYFIDWYKHHPVDRPPPPPGGRDRLYWFYRAHPAAAEAPGDPRGGVYPIGPVADEIYLTTILTAPGTLRVVSGEATKSYSLPNGVAHTRIPFNTGEQHFELWREGRRLIQAQGENIVPSITRYNFIYTTGWARDEAPPAER
jgi:glucan endo-1,3-alpha-glucosidase